MIDKSFDMTPLQFSGNDFKQLLDWSNENFAELANALLRERLLRLRAFTHTDWKGNVSLQFFLPQPQTPVVK